MMEIEGTDNTNLCSLGVAVSYPELKVLLFMF